MNGPFERVVVTLDAASENRTAIETAAQLAAQTNAPLHGIFVEDEDLLRLARLPFARQITFGAVTAPLTLDDAELHQRAAAERSRNDLFTAARRHDVKCTFGIVRGGSDGSLSGISARDLVVTGALTRPVAGHFRVACRWWLSFEIAPGPFLLAKRGSQGRAGSTVVILRDRSQAATRLLEAAAQVAEARDHVLTIVCELAGADRKEFDAWIRDRLKAYAVRVRFEMTPTDLAALQHLLSQLDCGLLAIEAGLVEGRPSRVREFAEGFACDVLIVR